jgi:enamine deaminase RidA (YjgF/YER057c/UK114 family)
MRVLLSKIQANWHRDERGRTSLPQRDSLRRNGGPAMPRSSIYVGEIAHQSPIPNASRIGNIIVSGLIRGADPATARLAATLEQQCALMFLHMRQVVEAGSATVEDIIKVTVWMKELQREPVNDDVSRPGIAPRAPDHGGPDGGRRARAVRFHRCGRTVT